MKLGFFMLISGSAMAANVGKIVGQLGLVEGDVYLDSKSVQKNASVREGSIIEVKEGRATLTLGKGSVFNLAKNSRMVVDQYAAKDSTHDESASLDLKFGRTRALILNQGGEKRDVKVRARAATMGVRGTEIFVDVPKDTSKPINFFTLEGKAEVTAFQGAAPVAVNQNQGVSTSGVQPAPQANTASSEKNDKGSDKNSDKGSEKGGDKGEGGAKQNASNDGKKGEGGNGPAPGGPPPKGDFAPPSMTITEVKAAIKKDGIGGAVNLLPPPPMVRPQQTNVDPGTLSNSTNNLPKLPTLNNDPGVSPNVKLNVTPRFCNAVSGSCLP